MRASWFGLLLLLCACVSISHSLVVSLVRSFVRSFLFVAWFGVRETRGSGFRKQVDLNFKKNLKLKFKNNKIQNKKA